MRLHAHLLIVTALVGTWLPGHILRGADIPASPPGTQAEPAPEQEREVSVPTGFRAARTADVLAVCESAEPMKPLKVKLRPRAALAATRKLFIYPEGSKRPADPRVWFSGRGDAPFKVSRPPPFLYALCASEPFGFVERGKAYVIEFELALYDTIRPPIHWMSPGKNDRLLWQTTYRQVIKEEPELPPDILAAKKRIERIKPQPVPPPDLPADFLRTDSKGWQQVLATEITAGFSEAVVSKVIPYLGTQAHADIRLKLAHTTPDQLGPFNRGYDHAQLRGVLYEIAEENRLVVKWELKDGSPVGIVVTDER